MTRAFGLMLLTWALTLGALAAQDPGKGKLDPPQGEKKVDPDPQKGDPQAAAEEELKKTKELIARVARNMQKAEERLGDKDPKDATQQLQRDIVKDLDELIEKAKKQNEQNQQQSGGGGGMSSGQMGGQSGEQSGSQSEQQSGGKSGDQSGSQGGAKSQSKSGGQGGEPGQQGSSKGGQGKEGGQEGQAKAGGKDGKDGQGGAGQDKKGDKDGGGNLARAKTSDDKLNPLADIYREIWGHLPDARRQEMDAYQKGRLMPRYEELLREYYRSISEQSRKRD